MSTDNPTPVSDESLKPVRWVVLGASNFALRVCLPGMKRGPLTLLQVRRAISATLGLLPRRSAFRKHMAVIRSCWRILILKPSTYNPLPNQIHVERTARAARGKDVLCEKPIALDAESAYGSLMLSFDRLSAAVGRRYSVAGGSNAQEHL